MVASIKRFWVLLPSYLLVVASFAPSSIRQSPVHASTSALENDKFKRDLEEKSRRIARGGGGETVAGAVLGGLLLGPFGALFGATVGSNLGASKAVDRAREEELDRLGVTPEMLKTAQDCAENLERSIEGLKATQDALSTQQSLARMLDREAETMYEKAKVALGAGDEDQAKQFLFQRTQTQNKLKGVLIQCAEAKKRLETMEENVSSIGLRAKEVEALMQRTISAKSTQDLGLSSEFSLPAEDPLLRKFKDAGIN